MSRPPAVQDAAGRKKLIDQARAVRDALRPWVGFRVGERTRQAAAVDTGADLEDEMPHGEEAGGSHRSTRLQAGGEEPSCDVARARGADADRGADDDEKDVAPPEEITVVIVFVKVGGARRAPPPDWLH